MDNGGGWIRNRIRLEVMMEICNLEGKGSAGGVVCLLQVISCDRIIEEKQRERESESVR